MMRLGEVLERLARPRLVAETPRWRQGDYCARCGTAPCRCPICHGAGYYRLPWEAGQPVPRPIECECHRRATADRATAELEQISILAGLGDFTFERFETTPEAADAVAEARSYAADPTGWLVLHGDVGVGKTHLAAAIGNELIARGDRVAMHVVPELLRELRRPFADGQSARYHELLDAARSAPVLVLDDYGAERSTDWAREQLFSIVDERYRRRLPLVVTTNNLGGTEARVRDRMTDDGLSVVVRIQGTSYRQRPVKFRGLRLVD